MQAYVISFVVMLVIFILLFAFFQWRHNKKLLMLSIRDPLSNLFNRRYVFDFLNKLVNTKRSGKSTVSIIVIDIDDFKQVNDRYGHPFGDTVICKIADIGTEIMRKEGVIGRVGGDEFLCVLPRIDAIQSLHIAQRFVNKVNSFEFIVEDQHHNTQVVKITISIGIATTSEDIDSSTQLYVQADKALYHAKESGKNRAMQYHESMQHAYQKESNARNYALDFDDND